MTDESQFHWAEGLKYVSEGIKGVFVLNGAAAVSILTFVGNLLANGGSTKTSFFVFAMLFFGIGAVLGPISFACAYLTQLSYGNYDQKRAWFSHGLVYWFFGASLLVFVIGLGFAAWGLTSVLSGPSPS